MSGDTEWTSVVLDISRTSWLRDDLNSLFQKTGIKERKSKRKQFGQDPEMQVVEVLAFERTCYPQQFLNC